MDKNALEQVLSFYNWWMGVSTVAVAVGILGEYVAHFVFEEEARSNKREMMVSILFGVLVLGGVVGEYIFGKKLSQASEQLQRIADSEVAQANKDAAEARRDADVARQQAADVEERAANLEKQAAQLRKDAEAEHLARAEIEAAVAWRQLSEHDKRDIGTSLTRYKSLAAASVWYNGSSTEAEMFANDIAEALQIGQIIVSPPAGYMEMKSSTKFGDPVKPVETGVRIQCTKHPSAIEFAGALIKELTNRGFDAHRQADPPFNEGKVPEIWVNVESRPKGPQGEYKLQAEREEKAKSRINAK